MQKQAFGSPDMFLRLIPGVKAFKIATITGFRILYLGQIVYFECIKKEWYVCLYDHNRLQLKSKTTAEDILGYSKAFVQINKHNIINIHFLSMISGNECILIPPFENKCSHKVSRIYKDILLKKFCSI